MTTECMWDGDDVVDRAAERLYGGPLSRDDMFDVATIISLVNGRMTREVRGRIAAQGKTRRLLVIDHATRSVSCKLQWLRESEPTLSDADVARTVDKLMHIVAQTVTVLERAPTLRHEQYPDAAS